MAAKKKEAPQQTAAQNAQMEDKLKALEHALAALDKQFGKGSVMKLGENANMQQVPVIPTGCITLDAALGVGGIPRGRIVEIFGPESSGKTTVALHIVAAAQKRGGICAFVDAEHALDPVYARKLGVNIDELYVSQPDTGEQALEIVEALVRSGALDVIVIDSVAALVPKQEIEGEMGDTFVGVQARMMSQALRKLTGSINKTGCCAVFINQLREKIGVMYGNPETTPGGRALKFYSSVRLDVRRTEQLKNGSEVVGYHTKVKVVKKYDKNFPKVGIEGICHNIIKSIYNKSTANIIRNNEKLKRFLLSSGIRQRWPHLPYFFNLVLEFLTAAISEEK